jgi:hypothetical protein
MLAEPDKPLSWRAVLALGLGLGIAAATPFGCSRSDSSSKARPMPPRLTFMRDKARAADAARPATANARARMIAVEPTTHRTPTATLHPPR